MAPRTTCLLLISGLITIMPNIAAAVDWLPDMIARESNLYDHDITTSILPGHVHLRLSNGTANIGLGPLHIYGSPPAPGSTTQEVFQRVYASDGTFYDRLAGQFIYHPNHGHVHFENWALYQLREILPNNGVGAVVATGNKTSFCLIDIGVHDATLPNFSGTAHYTSCGTTIQGISVGWYDVYGKYLPGQNIDITNVPDGTYWLESMVDPNNTVLESDETNNVARIQVTIGAPQPVNPDPYEPNDSQAATAARTIGAINSPHLGPTAGRPNLTGLTIDSATDDDWYRFYLAGTGDASNRITVQFLHALGDIDAHLFNAAGTDVGAGISVTDNEVISLNGLGSGWYDLHVYGYAGATHSDYGIAFRPPSNTAPTVSTDAPPAGTITLMHGIENYSVMWTAADPDGDPTWVSVYLNTAPQLDGNQMQLVSGVNVAGNLSTTLINSAEILPGTYWVYCTVTDGGLTAGAWSAGAVAFVDAPLSPVSTQPTVARIMTAMPNPFNPRTSFRLALTNETAVNIDIYDVRGRRVRHLFQGRLGPGARPISWDGHDDQGQMLPSGVYNSVIVAGAVVERGKIMLLK